MLIYLILIGGLAAGVVALRHPRPRIRRQASYLAAAAALVAMWHWSAW